MNFTDPESRVMKTAHGTFEHCYNAQVVVDAAQQIIVAAAVTDNAADVGQLVPLTEQAEANVGERAATMLADAGYKSEANFAALEARGLDGYVSLGKGEAQRVGTEAQGGAVHAADGREAAHRRRTPPFQAAQGDRRAAARVDQTRARLPRLLDARATQDGRGVEPGVPRDEPAADAARAGHRMTGNTLPIRLIQTSTRSRATSIRRIVAYRRDAARPQRIRGADS